MPEATVTPDVAIAVLPYGLGLGPELSALPLEDLHWPLGRPADLAGATIADLTAQDHLIVFPKTSMHFRRRWGTRAKVSVMMVEPRIIHTRHLRLLRLGYRRFHRVFTHDAATLKALPNARFLAAASTWVSEYATLDLNKPMGVSLIASARRDSEGHVLRHAVVDAVRAAGLDVDVMGRGYRPFEAKADGLAPYKFSVVIENIRTPGYFTEKLVDALLCETVPIYWGAPDIATHFDPGGMITCDRLDDVIRALRECNSARYEAMKPALMRAKVQAEAVQDYRQRAAELIRDQI